ncbi:MAG TPA: SDR family oxidoreductase [Alicyclobacillus sp.]|nr:SDR family oxidoreductase [Alicyclobacillus sp.]
MSLREKVALVTGAGQGIGLQTALTLAQAGADVALCGRGATKLEDAANRVRMCGQKAEIYVCDIRKVNQIEEMVREVNSQFGHIDILVNNAGIDIPKHAFDVTEEEWDAIIDTNLKGVFFCSQQVGKIMADNGGGSIVNVASEFSFVAGEKYSVYSISKGGVVQLTKALALEWADHNIRVNAVAPTLIETPMSEYLFKENPEHRDVLVGRIPLKRMGRPEEVAQAILFLVSEASSFITGTTLVVDGGRLSW